ncbi:hypothetical protein YC2023_029256 [Brassica napus]
MLPNTNLNSIDQFSPSTISSSSHLPSLTLIRIRSFSRNLQLMELSPTSSYKKTMKRWLPLTNYLDMHSSTVLQVLEIRPVIDWNKGRAVELLL